MPRAGAGPGERIGAAAQVSGLGQRPKLAVWGSTWAGPFHFDFLLNFEENSKRVTVASKWVSRNDFCSNFILPEEMKASAETF